jgi:P-type E1-E2 ATPase
LHPLSRALVAEGLKHGIIAYQPKELKEHPGLGVTAIVDGKRAALGRRSLLEDLGIDVNSIREEDVSQVWVAHDGKYIGRIFFRDQPRTEATEALSSMRALGIDRLILLTGDKSSIAHKVGDALGMDNVIAEVLPAQKLDVVRSEQSQGRTVMMVGDGVNDAPALAGADVGVAIGAELNEVAVGGADVALLGTDLRRLPKLIGLADVTRRIMNQNVWLVFGLSIVLIALAAAGILHPLTGALAQSIAVMAVVINSARIMRFEKEKPDQTQVDLIPPVPIPEPG